MCQPFRFGREEETILDLLPLPEIQRLELEQYRDWSWSNGVPISNIQEICTIRCLPKLLLKSSLTEGGILMMTNTNGLDQCKPFRVLVYLFN